MSFIVDPHLEARLREIARQQGRDFEAVVAEALQQFAEAASRDNGANSSQGPGEATRYPLRGSVVRYIDPCRPATSESDWESGE